MALGNFALSLSHKTNDCDNHYHLVINYGTTVLCMSQLQNLCAHDYGLTYIKVEKQDERKNKDDWLEKARQTWHFFLIEIWQRLTPQRKKM